MATESRNNFSALSQTQLNDLRDLAQRLRGHAKKISSREMGQDMLAGAWEIEERIISRNIPTASLVGDLPADEAMALAQMAHVFVYEDAERFSNRQESGADCDAMFNGITRLKSALADAGFAPH